MYRIGSKEGKNIERSCKEDNSRKVRLLYMNYNKYNNIY